MLCMLLLLLLLALHGVELERQRPRILIIPPISSYYNSHLINMERLGEFYAEHGYDVYLLGMNFLQTRLRNASSTTTTNGSVHLLTCPLLVDADDDAAERERLFRPSTSYLEEKLRPSRYGAYLVDRGLVECHAILSADDGRFVANLRHYAFELIIFERDCGLILADYLHIPSIIVDNAGIYPVYRSFVSLPLSSFPVFLVPFSDDMSLLQRTINVAAYCVMNVMISVTSHRRYARLYADLLATTNGGDLTQSYYNASMMFVNTRREFEYPLALMPNVLPIGCAYLKEHDSSTTMTTTDRIEELISGQKVIYVSFGTHHEFTASEYRVIMEAFSRLKAYRVVWQTRHKVASLTGVEHVRLVSWIDQLTVLSRNETQLFVGHGGLNSALESAYYGVPYLVIPMMGDQFYNCRRMQVLEMGRCLRKETLTEASLLEAIEAMLTNPVYKRNAMKLSRGMQSHDVKKDILYWTATIIEHKGWPFLDTPYKRLPWYSYFLLDVLAVISVCLLLAFAMLMLCCRCMCMLPRCCCCRAKCKSKAE